LYGHLQRFFVLNAHDFRDRRFGFGWVFVDEVNRFGKPPRPLRCTISGRSRTVREVRAASCR
jgi:hypothetical protein